MGTMAEKVFEALSTGGYSLLNWNEKEHGPNPHDVAAQLEGLPDIVTRAMHNGDGETAMRIHRAVQALGEAADHAMIQLEME
jgi:hypothetical protein